MHRALLARDVGCRYPGCSNARFVDAHHIEHWAHGGETSLNNLTLLCPRHHRYVHELGFSIERHGTSLRFVRPDGRYIPDVPEPTACSSEQGQEQLIRAHAEAAIHIDNRTATPRWDGQSPDYVWLVGSLCQSDLSSLSGLA
jgi:hypothetical protein